MVGGTPCSLHVDPGAPADINERKATESDIFALFVHHRLFQRWVRNWAIAMKQSLEVAKWNDMPARLPPRHPYVGGSQRVYAAKWNIGCIVRGEQAAIVEPRWQELTRTSAVPHGKERFTHHRTLCSRPVALQGCQRQCPH